MFIFFFRTSPHRSCSYCKYLAPPTYQPLFRPPWPRTLAYLSLLVRHVPLRVLGLAQPSWPKNQLQVLRSLLQAPAAIYAALTMAHDEMQRVRELDVDFLRAFAERLWVCYAEEDGWVGGQREEVLCALSGMLAEGRVVHSRRGVPHAFCISARVSLCLRRVWRTSRIFLTRFFGNRPQCRSSLAVCKVDARWWSFWVM